MRLRGLMHTGAALVLAMALAGCGGPAKTPATTATPSISVSDDATKPAPVTLDVTIIDGDVTPRGARVKLKVGQQLTLVVTSDQDAEIHVHTDPEREFPIKAGEPTRASFSSDRPGTVAVEVHELDAVIAEVLVSQ